MAGRGQNSLLEDRSELCHYSPANRLGLGHGSTTPGVRENSRGGGQVRVEGPASSSFSHPISWSCCSPHKHLPVWDAAL